MIVRLRRAGLLVGLQIMGGLHIAAQAPAESGLVVESVEAGSPVAGIGLMRGDRLLSYDDRLLLSSLAAFQVLQANTFGKTQVSMGVRRGEETRILSVPGGPLT